MRYPLWAAACAVLLAVCAMSVGVASAHAASCSNTFGSDGHGGPWYTPANQQLHGNNVTINCPTQQTSWSIRYQVVKAVCLNPSACQQFQPIDETRSGHGDASFSISVNPVGCNLNWDYWTHIHNIVTGGNINKPTDMFWQPCT